MKGKGKGRGRGDFTLPRSDPPLVMLSAALGMIWLSVKVEPESVLHVSQWLLISAKYNPTGSSSRHAEITYHKI